jgi:predicted RNase H-like HicB family nuclease
MVVVYPVIFTKTGDRKDTYLVEIPDIKGFTEGYGLSDAMRMARDYIGGYCAEKKDGVYPDASDAADIDVSAGMFAGEGESIVSLIDTDVDAYIRRMNNRSVRRNVSLPAWMSEAAEKQNINVSRVLQEALMEKLNISKA